MWFTVIYVVADIRERDEPSPGSSTYIGDVKGIAFNEGDAKKVYEAHARENERLPEEEQGIIAVYTYKPEYATLYAGDSGSGFIASVYLEGYVPSREGAFKKLHTPKQY